VEALRNNDYVVLAVEDDGIGRERVSKQEAEGSGEGLNIVNEQLKFFNKSNVRKAYIEVVDLYDSYGNPSGTRFELHITVDNG